jgi:cycloeucalenol cycloisomerase
MPAWRLNGVPIAMFFATHFYFSSYHVLANLVLRKARTAHAPGWRRAALTVALIGAMSYTTAFMETLTISNFPYYDFENRDMAYTVGSAFYGLYFIVSFPVYHALDEPDLRGPASLADVAFSSLGSAMAVLLLLDVSRLLLDVPLTIGGTLWEVTG